MKNIMSILLTLVCLIVLVGCSGNPPSNSHIFIAPASTAAPSLAPTESDLQEKKKPAGQIKGDIIPTMNIQVGKKNFTATLFDNESTRALMEKLPMTLKMDDLNGNEKFYFFSENFPSNSERVGNIKTGELMFFGSNCLVLFYESFSPSYSYTRLGYIDDATGLASTIGGGSVEVTFSTGE